MKKQVCTVRDDPHWGPTHNDGPDPGQVVYMDATDVPEPDNRVQAYVCKRCGVVYVPEDD